ncbi:MAG: PadR family transcriptional regulator [Acidobacteriota bacterium]|jgi:PadR family transcriptional regulator, regulatory protein PadR
MKASNAEIPYGTLDLLVLQTLNVMGPMHGFGLARRIEQVSDNLLQLNQGSIYPALLRLRQQGWIRASWGKSDNNRRARFYSITEAGQRKLAREVKAFEQTTALVNRFLEVGS